MLCVVCFVFLFYPPPPCKLEQKVKRADPSGRLEAASGMNLVIKTPGPQAQLVSALVAVWVTPLPRGGLGTDSAVERRVPALGKAPSFWDKASPNCGHLPKTRAFSLRAQARRSAGSPASTKTLASFLSK